MAAKKNSNSLWHRENRGRAVSEAQILLRGRGQADVGELLATAEKIADFVASGKKPGGWSTTTSVPGGHA